MEQYPAVFEKEQEGGYSIYFPDIEGCYTQAETLAEGVENATDALSLMLSELSAQGRPLPKPSKVEDIKTLENEKILLITSETAYANSGSTAGTYTRPSVGSTVWTRR